MGFTGGSAGKESACNLGDLGLIFGLGKSPGEGKHYPLQHSGLENSMDHIVHRVIKSWTWLSDLHFCWIIEKTREFQKNIYFCFNDYAKAFDYVDHNKLWKILKEMGIPDHLTCLLRNLYAGQQATVRTGHGIKNWFQTGKGVCESCILSPCLFNLYPEHIMQKSGLDEAQAWIKIVGKIINNLRYADDTTLMANAERN